MGRQAVERQHAIHLRIGKAKGRISDIRYRVYLQIVQTCEDTFLGDSEAPRKYRKVQTVVVFSALPRGYE